MTMKCLIDIHEMATFTLFFFLFVSIKQTLFTTETVSQYDDGMLEF